MILKETSDRIFKVARTITDLAGKEQIKSEHISEAIQSVLSLSKDIEPSTTSSGFDPPGYDFSLKHNKIRLAIHPL